MTHDELIRLCGKNNRAAQNLLFATFERKVLGICLRYASSIDEAKDFQQESFIKIFQSLEDQKEIGSLDGWISRITVNTAIDYFRKRKTMAATPLEKEAPLSVSPDILDKLNEEELLELVKSIPDSYRIVFNLYIIEGFSHKEIAERLGMGESTSRSYLVRAKDHIQKCLATHPKKLKKSKVVWTA